MKNYIKYICLIGFVSFLTVCKPDNPAEPEPLLRNWKVQKVMRNSADISNEYTQFRLQFTSATAYTLVKKDGTSSSGTWIKSGANITLSADGILTNLQVTDNQLLFSKTEVDDKLGNIALQFTMISE
jgi:hypothetical protein